MRLSKRKMLFYTRGLSKSSRMRIGFFAPLLICFSYMNTYLLLYLCVMCYVQVLCYFFFSSFEKSIYLNCFCCEYNARHLDREIKQSTAFFSLLFLASFRRPYESICVRCYGEMGVIVRIYRHFIHFRARTSTTTKERKKKNIEE